MHAQQRCWYHLCCGAHVPGDRQGPVGVVLVLINRHARLAFPEAEYEGLIFGCLKCKQQTTELLIHLELSYPVQLLMKA